jgi:hypothetical protein
LVLDRRNVSLFRDLATEPIFTLRISQPLNIEVLFGKVTVFMLLLFASLPDCSQNQTAVSDTLRLLSDF